MAGDRHKLRAAQARLLERLKEHIDVLLPAVQLLRAAELRRLVVTAQHKRGDALPGLPLPEALHEIRLEPNIALVALLRSLREEAHHDIGERPRNTGLALVGRR